MAVRSVGATANTLLGNTTSTSTSSTTDLEELQEELEESYKKKYEEMLQQLQSNSTDTTTKTYSTMSSSAEDVGDALSVIQAAVESGDTATAISNISDFVTSYNSMLASMSSAGGAENNAMITQFKKYFSENEEALKSVGITASSSGVLSLDTETLASADADSLSAVFGTDNELTEQISKLSDTVMQVASLKISGYNSLQTMYGNSGTLNSKNLVASILDAFS